MTVTYLDESDVLKTDNQANNILFVKNGNEILVLSLGTPNEYLIPIRNIVQISD